MEQNVFKHEARGFLRELIKLNTRMEINRIEQDSAESRAQGCTGSNEVKVQTSGKDSMALAVAELMELQTEYDEMYAEFLGRRTVAREIIDKIEKPEHRSMLRLRYFAGLRLDAIAEQLHYSPQYVKHLHGRALEAFGRAMLDNALKDDTECHL